MSTKTVCGVQLVDEAYALLGDAIAPYVQTGRIGKFIYCESAVQNGNFLDMRFRPEQCDGTVQCPMQVSVPVNFVKFMAAGINEKQLGFLSGQQE
ncbi:hypothetical protein H3H37_20790 [Duganella sp. LX20W]|uniref:Uncharacterized protein n=1 Tax=Rugamonas brunnea TaxID=2758569 RepID=A0A7W2EVR6_9BURK|nr:hypothetical protein [Rugamonas brunnea]MBA5639503.1 hypothetical protein [Rugamonas brunnea]